MTTTIEVTDTTVNVYERHPTIGVDVAASADVTIEIDDVTLAMLVASPEIALSAPETSVEVVVAQPVIEVELFGSGASSGGGGDGSRITFTKTAAVVLSGDRVVAPRPDGTVEYATNAVAADANRPLWLTLTSAASGSPVEVLAFGETTEGSWSWTPGLPIFLGANGVLTQTPPVAPGAKFILQVAATTDAPTSLFYDPRNPIALI